MKKNILKHFDNLIYFTKDSLRAISTDSNLTISMNIHRWKKSKDIVVFKNGIYATKDSYKKNSMKEGYYKFISSILLEPSYISLATVLSEHDILTEGVYNVTAVTTKLPVRYSDGKYSYRQITEKLFCGYKIRYFDECEYYEATKAKALFDYIYYRRHRIDTDVNVVEDLRLKLELFTKKDFKEMRTYANIVSSDKLLKIINNLEEHAYIN